MERSLQYYLFRMVLIQRFLSLFSLTLLLACQSNQHQKAQSGAQNSPARAAPIPTVQIDSLRGLSVLIEQQKLFAKSEAPVKKASLKFIPATLPGPLNGEKTFKKEKKSFKSFKKLPCQQQAGRDIDRAVDQAIELTEINQSASQKDFYQLLSKLRESPEGSVQREVATKLNEWSELWQSNPIGYLSNLQQDYEVSMRQIKKTDKENIWRGRIKLLPRPGEELVLERDREGRAIRKQTIKPFSTVGDSQSLEEKQVSSDRAYQNLMQRLAKNLLFSRGIRMAQEAYQTYDFVHSVEGLVLKDSSKEAARLREDFYSLRDHQMQSLLEGEEAKAFPENPKVMQEGGSHYPANFRLKVNWQSDKKVKAIAMRRQSILENVLYGGEAVDFDANEAIKKAFSKIFDPYRLEIDPLRGKKETAYKDPYW